MALHSVAAAVAPLVPAQAGGLLVVWLLFFVVFGILLPYWVYTDAKSKGSDNPVLWAIIVFLAPLLGLVLYLVLGDDY